MRTLTKTNNHVCCIQVSKGPSLAIWARRIKRVRPEFGYTADEDKKGQGSCSLCVRSPKSLLNVLFYAIVKNIVELFVS